MVFSMSGEFSTEQPQMIRARLEILAPTRAAAFSASETVMVGPPMTRTRAPVGAGQLDAAQQGGGEGFGDRFRDPIGGTLALAEPDQGDPAVLHDGQDVGVVEVHEARARDDLGDALDRRHQTRVRELEGGVEGHPRDELEELVVLDDDGGVTDPAEALQAVPGLLHPRGALAGERERDDAHRRGRRIPWPGERRGARSRCRYRRPSPR